jgi:hypothetical protein
MRSLLAVICTPHSATEGSWELAKALRAPCPVVLETEQGQNGVSLGTAGVCARGRIGRAQFQAEKDFQGHRGQLPP